jgi:hypothetical protein
MQQSNMWGGPRLGWDRVSRHCDGPAIVVVGRQRGRGVGHPVAHEGRAAHRVGLLQARESSWVCPEVVAAHITLLHHEWNRIMERYHRRVMAVGHCVHAHARRPVKHNPPSQPDLARSPSSRMFDIDLLTAGRAL